MKRKIKSLLIGIPLGIAVVFSVGFQSDFFEIAKQIDIYTMLFKELNMYYVDEINPAELTKHSINNMLENLDPYTRYYDEQGVEDARIEASGEYGGIGAQTRFTDNALQVRDILKGSPAEEAGIKSGDKILKINSISVGDFDEQGASTLLNGVPGTKVKLSILRQNRNIELEVTRDKISINPVPYFTMLDNEVGYLSFTMFNETAAIEVRKAYEELKSEGMKKLIIDVRSNPGGLLNEAVRIVNYFVPKDQIVVTTKAKIEKWSDTYKTTQAPLDLEIPLVVLVDDRSASASEILAGALQDYDRAVIVGQRSFGKGLVQRYRPLSYGTQMKVTISKYYTPSGRCIQELDYTNRKKDGEVPKFSDYGPSPYKTASGRTVFGGGGIRPDIEITKPETTGTTEVLLSSDALFNYITEYFYKNDNISDPTEFNLTDTDYRDFKAYLSQHHADFETTSELKFNEALEVAKSDNLDKNLTRSYQNLLEELQEEKLDELDKNKEEILNKLTDEIVNRYYYKEGVYKQKATFDKTILEAVSLLNNLNSYNKVLEK